MVVEVNCQTKELCFVYLETWISVKLNWYDGHPLSVVFSKLVWRHRWNMGILLPFCVHFNNCELDIVGVNYLQGDFIESYFIVGRVQWRRSMSHISWIHRLLPAQWTWIMGSGSELGQGPLRTRWHAHTYTHTPTCTQTNSYVNAAEPNPSRQAGRQHLNCN